MKKPPDLAWVLPQTLPEADDALIAQMWLSAIHFPALTVAHEVGVFDLLLEEPLSACDVATRLHLDDRGTEAILGVLAGSGLLLQMAERYHLTPVARHYLTPESPFYMGPILERLRLRPVTHTELKDMLRTGRRTGEPRLTEIWARGTLTSELAEAETRFQHAHSLPAALALAGTGQLDAVTRLLDVGGGSGCFAVAAAQRSLELRAVILELREVAEVTRKHVAESGVSRQVEVLAADMFQCPWPSGFDGVLLSNVLHDWSWERCEELCRRAYDALTPGGSIFIHEMLLSDSRDGPLAACSFSLWMAWSTEGRQLSPAECEHLLRSGGFEEISFVPVHGHYILAVARKPEHPRGVTEQSRSNPRR